jgi:hypothetical protein
MLRLPSDCCAAPEASAFCRLQNDGYSRRAGCLSLEKKNACARSHTATLRS